MASTSEVGNAKNVANFQDLISFVTGYGATYNPSKTSLKLPALETLQSSAYDSLDDVVTKKTIYNNAVNDRVIAFKDLKTLATRLIGALQATDAAKEKVDDAKSFNKKLQGTKPPKTTATPDPNAPVPVTISNSQQSYDQQIQHFAGIISVLSSEPTYSPNEAELIPALNAKESDLTLKNNTVATTYTQVSNSRISRDEILYAPEVGLFFTAADIKVYIKSLFGATSPQYAQVKGIKFTLPKK